MNSGTISYKEPHFILSIQSDVYNWGIMFQNTDYSWQLVANPQGVVDSADFFILLGFGLAKDTEGDLLPGASNLALARWLIAHNTERKPTITQLGTELALKQLAADSAEYIHPLPHNDDVHVDTHGAALQIWLLAEQNKWRRPCLVTHPLQSERAHRIFAKLPFDALILPAIPQDAIPLTPDSIQRWTRNRFNYTLFEWLMARPIAKIFGWL